MPPLTSIADSLVGHVLDGRYRITQRLARGGMATVYQAEDTRLTRTVAVKVMHVGLGDDAEFARKFDREARAAARLSHPHVVSVFDQGLAHVDGHGPRPYIVMEFVDGITLRDVISSDAPLSPLRALELIEPVLGALASAHDAGLVHRDVKPENVLISDRGQIKVADFGLAKAISSQTSTATQGLLIGTVSYLPPELVLSGKADARSDVYSAGVVLFELLTGRKPHTGETPIQVAYAHVHHDIPPPSSYRTAEPIPAYLDALIARVTARDADLRPPDARAMLIQVRRVAVALRGGVSDDPELTQDLSPVLGGDRLDAEPTQLVGGRPTPAYEAPRATWHVTSSPTEATFDQHAPRIVRTPAPRTPTSPPTILDAPPPTARLTAGVPTVTPDGTRQLYEPSPERLAEQRQWSRRRRRRGLLAFVLVLALAVGAAATGWYLTEGRFTAAPALTSMTEAEAEELAASAGLQVSFAREFSETVPKGTVVSTEPGAGIPILDGGEMSAVVSQGPERYPMPAVVGRTQTQAEAALAKANLDLGKVTAGYSESVPAGVVTAASQPKGAKLKRDTDVALSVSKGPEPIRIRDFEGRPADAAAKALEKAGFTVKVTDAHSDRVPTGRVITQTPNEGNGERGDAIALKRSIGPVMITVPNVTRMGVKAAEKVMAEAGFKVRVRPVAVNYIGVGYVVYSSPRSAAKAPKGSTITLYVV